MGFPTPESVTPADSDVEVHFVVYYSTAKQQWFICDEVDSYLPDGDTWNNKEQEWNQDERYDDLRESLYHQAGERLRSGTS